MLLQVAMHIPVGIMHNLFGDTNAVHVTFNKKTGDKIDTVINGGATWESLKCVEALTKNINRNSY